MKGWKIGLVLIVLGFLLYAIAGCKSGSLVAVAWRIATSAVGGEYGEDGIKSVDGLSGDNGEGGEAGEMGEAGFPGADGLDGRDRSDGNVGPTSATGADGQDGQDRLGLLVEEIVEVMVGAIEGCTVICDGPPGQQTPCRIECDAIEEDGP